MFSMFIKYVNIKMVSNVRGTRVVRVNIIRV